MTTFRDKRVVQQLGANFYAVALNAESREPVRLAGHTFKFKPTGPNNGVHELALALARDEYGQVPYPTIVLLDEKLQVRGRWPGLIKANQLTAALEKLQAER
jgi:thioredoxin-related protein